jgi:hypothetical protein
MLVSGASVNFTADASTMQNALSSIIDDVAPGLRAQFYNDDFALNGFITHARLSPFYVELLASYVDECELVLMHNDRPFPKVLLNALCSDADGGLDDLDTISIVVRGKTVLHLTVNKRSVLHDLSLILELVRKDEGDVIFVPRRGPRIIPTDVAYTRRQGAVAGSRHSPFRTLCNELFRGLPLSTIEASWLLIHARLHWTNLSVQTNALAYCNGFRYTDSASYFDVRGCPSVVAPFTKLTILLDLGDEVEEAWRPLLTLDGCGFVMTRYALRGLLLKSPSGEFLVNMLGEFILRVDSGSRYGVSVLQTSRTNELVAIDSLRVLNGNGNTKVELVIFAGAYQSSRQSWQQSLSLHGARIAVLGGQHPGLVIETNIVSPFAGVMTSGAHSQSLSANQRLSQHLVTMPNDRVTPGGAAILERIMKELPTVKRRPTDLQLNVLAKIGSAMERPLFELYGAAISQLGDEVVDSSNNITLVVQASNEERPLTISQNEFKEKMLDCTNGGIVSLETGAGKTATSLIALKLFQKAGVPNLAVAPDDLLEHWRGEAIKFGVDVVCIANSEDMRSVVGDSIISDAVYVLSHTAVRSVHKFALFPKEFFLTMVDEAPNMKPGRVTFKCLFEMNHQHVWPISATPSAGIETLKRMAGVTQLQQRLNVPSCRDTLFISRNVLHGTKNNKERLRLINNNNVDEEETKDDEEQVERKVVIEADYIEQPADVVKRAHRALDGLTNKTSAMSTSVGNRILNVLERICTGVMLCDDDVAVGLVEELVQQANVETASSAAVSGNVANNTYLRVFNELAPKEAYGDMKDCCVVCLDPFNEPVQLPCNHVLCKTCASGVLRSRNSSSKRCPTCRATLRVPVTVYSRPRFKDAKPDEQKKQKKNKRKITITTKQPKNKKKKIKDVASSTSLLNQVLDDLVSVETNSSPSSSSSSSSLSSSSSPSSSASSASSTTPPTEDTVDQLMDMLCFDLKQSAWPKLRHVVMRLLEFKNEILSENPLSKLLLFTKRDIPASLYHRAAMMIGLPVLLAGVCRTKRKQSVKNIQTFKSSSRYKILIANYRYAEGHDFCNVSHCLVTDFDRRMHLLIQAIGRITRIGQEHEVVLVRIIINRDCYDHYLYENRNIVSGAHFSRALAAGIEWHALKNVPGTRANSVKTAIEHVLRLGNFAQDVAPPLKPHTNRPAIVVTDTNNVEWSVDIARADLILHANETRRGRGRGALRLIAVAYMPLSEVIANPELITTTMMALPVE